MPLLKGKSSKVFKHNLKEELNAGKPKAQSLAISYDMQRRSKGNARKKMADGGYNSDDPNLQDAETAGNSTSTAEKRAEAADEAKRLHEAVRRGWNSPEAPHRGIIKSMLNQSLVKPKAARFQNDANNISTRQNKCKACKPRSTRCVKNVVSLSLKKNSKNAGV